MRYDTLVIFYQNKETYDPAQGKHIDNPVELYRDYANVNSTGIQQSTELFGAVKTNSLTVRFAHRIPIQSWNYITIGNKPNRYKTTQSLGCLNSDVIVTSEMIANGS